MLSEVALTINGMIILFPTNLTTAPAIFLNGDNIHPLQIDVPSDITGKSVNNALSFLA